MRGPFPTTGDTASPARGPGVGGRAAVDSLGGGLWAGLGRTSFERLPRQLYFAVRPDRHLRARPTAHGQPVLGRALWAPSRVIAHLVAERDRPGPGVLHRGQGMAPRGITADPGPQEQNLGGRVLSAAFTAFGLSMSSGVWALSEMRGLRRSTGTLRTDGVLSVELR